MVVIDIRTSASQPGKVSCEYCSAWSKTPWFLAKNLPQHLKCASHLKSAGEECEKREIREALNRLRAQDLERLQRSGHQYAPLSHVRQPEPPGLSKPPPELDEQQMWNDFELDRPNASLLNPNSEDQHDPMEQKEAEFYKVLNRAETNFDLTGWGFDEFNIERDVDETLTNVMRDLGQMQRFTLEFDGIHNQLDLDDSLEEDDVLAGIGLSHPGGPQEPDEWFPYPNKIVSVTVNNTSETH